MNIIKKEPIVEIFESVQGEAKTLGVPSTFVRFHGCNLNCKFCDSKYANSPEGLNSAKYYTPFQLSCELRKLKPHNIVFTGGEPMLKQEFIIETIRKINIKGKKYTYEIETNGTIIPHHLLNRYIDQFNISPKLKSSGNSISDSLNTEALNKMYLPHKAFFKFVVKNEDDIVDILIYKETFPLMPIYLMPEGKTRKEVIRNSKNLIEICLRYNLVLTTRLHVLLWNDKRGV